MACTTVWHCLYSEPDPELSLNGKYNSKIKNIKGYYYDEMIKRLNSVDRGIVGSVGYFLRRLWDKYEGKLTVHKADLYEEWDEHKQKENKKEFEEMTRKRRVKEICFCKNKDDGTGVWGVYTDLLYDTYKKDWTKAYQYTFHELFHNIDYLANPVDDEFFSHAYSNRLFKITYPDVKIDWESGSVREEKCQFGEIILREASINEESFKTNKNLSKYDKAPLCDIIGGALIQDRYIDEYGGSFGHNADYWLGINDFTKLLAVETFAHMAATAVVNPNAFDTMKESLPNSYKMFIEILKQMTGIYR